MKSLLLIYCLVFHFKFLADVGRHFDSYLQNQKLVREANIKNDLMLMGYGVVDACSQSFLRVGSGNVGTEISCHWNE